MTKRTKALDISKKVKDKVWERDGRCVICGSPQAMPNAHYISRAQGGLGIERNVVTLCICCHHDLDHTVKRERLKLIVKRYLSNMYDDWEEEKLIYKKWSENNE